MSVDSKQYITVDDFSPGIHSAGSWEIYGAADTVIPGPIPGAPVGSAQETGTYRCVLSADRKSIGPGPDYAAQTISRDLVAPGVASTDNLKVTGIVCRPDAGTSATPSGVTNDGVTPILAVSSYDNPTAVYHTLTDIAAATNQLTRTFAGSGSGSNEVFTAAFAKMSMNPTTPYLTAGNYVIIFQYDNYTALFSGFSVVPNPSTPTVKSSVNSTVGHYRVFSHQNRLVYVSIMRNATWNGAANEVAGDMFSAINFTDPPNSNVFPTAQAQLFESADQTGFGAFGAVNANTLLMVKTGGGGVVCQGDIANPVITYVPAVQGTAGMSTQVAITPAGMIYGSWKNGAHVWTGGATSQKISPQLRDNFFLVPVDQAPLVMVLTSFQTTRQVSAFGGWQSGFVQWGKYVVTSNNWMYDMESNGWWRIEDPSSYVMQFADKSLGDQYLWYTAAAMGSGPYGATLTWGRRYSRTDFASSWSWHSNPIPISQSPNKMAAIDEIIVEAQGISGSTLTITARGYDGSTSGSTGSVTAPVTVTLPAEAANQPVKIRIPFSIMCYNLIIKVEANDPGGATAPTVRSISFGIDEGNLVAVQ